VIPAQENVAEITAQLLPLNWSGNFCGQITLKAAPQNHMNSILSHCVLFEPSNQQNAPI